MWSSSGHSESDFVNSKMPPRPPTRDLVVISGFQHPQPLSQLTQSDESSSSLVPYVSRTVAIHGGTLTGSKRSSSPTPPASSVCTTSSPAGNKRSKRRKTAPLATPELCCHCTASSTCHPRNCPCAKAGRPCRNDCGPGENNKCTNSCEAINGRLEHLNKITRRGPSSQVMRTFVNLPISPPRHALIKLSEYYNDIAASPDGHPAGSEPPTQLPSTDTVPDNTTAPIQADDTGAATTQDSTVAAGGDAMGDPTIHLGGAAGSGTTVEEAEEAGPVIADAVTPNTTNTADGDGTNAEVGGGIVHVAAPTGDIARDMTNATTNGDGNPPVQHVNANANADARTTNGGERGENEAQIDGIVANGAEADTPPPAVPTAEVAADGQPAVAAVEQYTPLCLTAAEIVQADPNMQDITPADQKLISIYGDTIHHNDGRHLDGGIGVNEDRKWQRLHFRVASCTLALYDLPNGRWATRFLDILTKLWRATRLRECNSEKPLVFAACILCKVKDVKRFSDVKKLIWGRLDAWEANQHCALVKGVEEEAAGRGYFMPSDREFEVESAGRRYNSMILSGKLRAAVRMVTDRDPGGLFKPDDKCSKTGRPVIEVLREKHPEARVPSEEDFDLHPGGPECFESPPIYCYEENVAKVAARLSGGAGPCGVDGIMLKNWMLRHGAHSENLRAEIAHWVCWLSNGSPPYAAYRALNTVRELAADKRPGVRPLGCGETWMRLMANCNHTQSKVGATAACGNIQLCAGLQSGIEANLHAVRAIWPQSAGWLHDGGNEGDGAGNVVTTNGDGGAVNMIAISNRTQNDDAGVDEDVSNSCYTPDSGYGAALFDARNAFNELNRYLMSIATDTGGCA